MEENNQVKDQELYDDEEFELSHTDKLVGIFTEPKVTFEQISKFPAKATDWFIPLILMALVAIFSNIIMMSNPTIKYQIVEERLNELEEKLDKEVEAGNITREKADSQLEFTREMMEGNNIIGLLVQGIGTVIALFIFFTITAIVFHALSKIILKGQGTYAASLVAYGLPYYVYIIHMIIMVLIAMAMDKYIADLSIATFADLDKHTFVGFILSKLDPFSIWFYGLIAIGLAKMHKSNEVGKYMGLVYGSWLGFSLILFILSKYIPFFQNFIM